MKTAVRATVLGALVLTLTACQPVMYWLDDFFAPVGGWVKPGASEADQKRDQEECQRAASASEGPASSARRVYERCMRERGYELGSI